MKNNSIMFRISMKFRHLLILGALLTLTAATGGCDAPNPNANTPTSGQLILYVDEMYAPLIRALADTFMLRSPNAKIEVRTAPARMALQGLLDMQAKKSPEDTAASVAAVLGRKLLPDEREVITAAELNTKEYVLGYDGIAVAVPVGSPLKTTTFEQLRAALHSPAPLLSMLDSAAPATPIHFVLSDQNSSTLPVLTTFLHNDSINAAARYFGSGDSVLADAAAGDRIALVGWYVAHRDSARMRTLSIGFTDSTRTVHPPVRVHPSSLVTGVYPWKQPLVGYTFALTNSLAVGFLAWLAKSQDAQYYLTYQNLQPENVRLRLLTTQEEPE
jgi:ABC-type phosphate transport system substrate-binding protein